VSVNRSRARTRCWTWLAIAAWFLGALAPLLDRTQASAPTGYLGEICSVRSTTAGSLLSAASLGDTSDDPSDAVHAGHCVLCAGQHGNAPIPSAPIRSPVASNMQGNRFAQSGAQAAARPVRRTPEPRAPPHAA
jgi:hypothetical protein